jgi:hypothetical protein
LGKITPIAVQSFSEGVPKTTKPKDPTAAERQRRHRQRKREPEAESVDFTWDHDGFVVLKDQPATAIYFNPAGDLVIRQKCAWDQNEDSIIVIAAQNITPFLNGMRDAFEAR